LRILIEESAESNDKFFENLRLATGEIDEKEISLRSQGYIGIIKQKEWSKVISILNQKLTSCLQTSTSETLELSVEVALQVEEILNFSQKFFHVTRRRTHAVFIDKMSQLIMSDDWNLVIKTLRVIADYSTRNKGNETLFQENVIQWLTNMSLGINLKASNKISTLAMLIESSDMSFQYYSEGKQVPSIRTIKLSHLKGNKESSFKLAKEIAKSAEVPESLFPALWCKVRIAKIPLEDHLGHYRMVLASLLSYKIFCIFC
jgi:hypothetical protein